jgi:hypothetical protein
MVRRVLGVAVVALLSGAALAAPEGAPPTAAVPAPEDSAYPGTLTLAVDATDTTRHIFTVKEQIPVAGPGPLTLLFPKWLPGEHAPVGPIAQMAGLVITANGKRLEWQRDPVEMTAFHVKIPDGVSKIDIQMQRLAMSEDKFGGTVMTSNIVAVKWSSLSLYPAGYATSRIAIKPEVTLPHGWSYAVGLDGAKPAGDTISFAATSYETLVDSPLYAGRHTRQIDLDPGSAAPVRLTSFADHDEDLEARPDQIEAHRALVRQAYKLFGSRHYDHYDFQLVLNERMSDLGIEHHRSSENGYNPRYFTDWDGLFFDHDLLAHEFVPRRHADQAAIPREAGGRGGADGCAHRPRLALAAGHHQWRDPRFARRPHLFRLGARPRLLCRRRPDLARRRHADPRPEPGHQIARRFRPRLFRHR